MLELTTKYKVRPFYDFLFYFLVRARSRQTFEINVSVDIHILRGYLSTENYFLWMNCTSVCLRQSERERGCGWFQREDYKNGHSPKNPYLVYILDTTSANYMKASDKINQPEFDFIDFFSKFSAILQTATNYFFKLYWLFKYINTYAFYLKHFPWKIDFLRSSSGTVALCFSVKCLINRM